MNATTTTATQVRTTAAEWEEQARQCRQDAYRSMEESDSDGFMTQWASQKMAHRYLGNAEIARDGYTMAVYSLFDLDGNLLTTDRREGQYGMYFFNREAEGKARFVRESEAQSFKAARKANEKKGVRVGWAKVGVEFNEQTGCYDPVIGDVQGIETADWYGDQIALGADNYEELREIQRG